VFAKIQIVSCFRSTTLAYRHWPREFRELAEQVLRVEAGNLQLAGPQPDRSSQVGQHPATALAPPLGRKTRYLSKCLAAAPGVGNTYGAGEPF